MKRLWRFVHRLWGAAYLGTLWFVYPSYRSKKLPSGVRIEAIRERLGQEVKRGGQAQAPEAELEPESVPVFIPPKEQAALLAADPEAPPPVPEPECVGITLGSMARGESCKKEAV